MLGGVGGYARTHITNSFQQGNRPRFLQLQGRMFHKMTAVSRLQLQRMQLRLRGKLHKQFIQGQPGQNRQMLVLAFEFEIMFPHVHQSFDQLQLQGSRDTQAGEENILGPPQITCDLSSLSSAFPNAIPVPLVHLDTSNCVLFRNQCLLHAPMSSMSILSMSSEDFQAFPW